MKGKEVEDLDKNCLTKVTCQLAHVCKNGSCMSISLFAVRNRTFREGRTHEQTTERAYRLQAYTVQLRSNGVYSNVLPVSLNKFVFRCI